MKLTRLKLLPLFVGSILLLVFAQPSLAGIVAGLVLIMVGEFFRIWGCGHLQKNNELTVTGPYAYVKNPLYLGSVLIAVGFCLLANNIYLLAGLSLMFSLYYIPYKKTVESDRLRTIFGSQYNDYDAKVPDYWPQMTPYSAQKAPWQWRLFFKNSEAGIPLLLLSMVMLILTRPHWIKWLGLQP